MGIRRLGEFADLDWRLDKTQANARAFNFAESIFCETRNPSLSGRGICALQHNCCGAGMVQDGPVGHRLGGECGPEP